MKTRTEIIRNIEELEAVTRNSFSKKALKVEFVFLSNEQNYNYQKKLNESFNSCGCATGKKFVGITFILSLFAVFLKIPPFQTSFQFIIGTVFLFTLIAAILGKLFGLFLAKRRFRKIIWELRALSENIDALPAN